MAGELVVDGKLPVSRTWQRHTFLVSEAVLYLGVVEDRRDRAAEWAFGLGLSWTCIALGHGVYESRCCDGAKGRT